MECSMCGDVGFAEHLFQCGSCLSRFQHRYCSRAFYNDFGHKNHAMLCDWCLADVESEGLKVLCRKRMRFEDAQRERSGDERIKAVKVSKEKGVSVFRKGKKQDSVSQRTSFVSKSRRRFRPLNEIIC